VTGSPVRRVRADGKALCAEEGVGKQEKKICVSLRIVKKERGGRKREFYAVDALGGRSKAVRAEWGGGKERRHRLANVGL